MRGVERGFPRTAAPAARRLLSSFDRFVVAPMLSPLPPPFRCRLPRLRRWPASTPVLWLDAARMGDGSRTSSRVRCACPSSGSRLRGSLRAPNLSVLIAARALLVGLFGALIPASPSLYRRHGWYGISAEGARRLDGRLGRGHGAGNPSSGGCLYLDGWRIAFAAPAPAGAALAVLLARLPEPSQLLRGEAGGATGSVGRVLDEPWALVVVGIAFVEGAVILGFLTFLAPSLPRVSASAPRWPGWRSDSTVLRCSAGPGPSVVYLSDALILIGASMLWYWVTPRALWDFRSRA